MVANIFTQAPPPPPPHHKEASYGPGVYIWSYEFYSMKPSYFTETKIYVKLDPKVANTAHSSHLKCGIIYWQWNYIF